MPRGGQHGRRVALAEIVASNFDLGRDAPQAGLDEPGIALHGLAQQHEPRLVAVRVFGQDLLRLQEHAPRLEIGGAAHQLGLADLELQVRGHRLRDLCLHREDVLELAGVFARPHRRGVAGLQQLHGDLHAQAGLAHGAGDDVGDAETPCDVVHWQRRSLEVIGRGACRHLQSGHAREGGDQLVAEPSSEALVVGFAADAFEGQHRDRFAGDRLAHGHRRRPGTDVAVASTNHLPAAGNEGDDQKGHGQERTRSDPAKKSRPCRGGTRPTGGAPTRDGRRPRLDLKHSHRADDILEAARAEIRAVQIDAAGYGLLHRLRDHDAARIGLGLQPGGDVHAVAVDGAVGLLDHVAKMDANAKAQRAAGRRPGGDGDTGELPLRRDRGVHGTGRGAEHRQHRIARHVDDAAPVGFDAGAEDLACGGERRDCAVLVRRHQPRIARPIGRQDGQQAMRSRAGGHGSHDPDFAVSRPAAAPLRSLRPWSWPRPALRLAWPGAGRVEWPTRGRPRRRRSSHGGPRARRALEWPPAHDRP